MKTILLTAIGGDIAQGIAAVIQSLDYNYRLIGTDIQAQHGGDLYVDASFIVPPASAPGYEDAILALIRSQNVDFVVPVSEPELAIWVNSPALLSCSAQIAMAGEVVVRIGLDKLKTNRKLKDLGVKVPWTMDVEHCESPLLPCIMKGRLGSGSRDIAILEKLEDVAYHRSRIQKAVYQELLLPAGQEVTVAVYRTRQKKVAVFQMLRKLSGGLTSWVEIIDNPEVSAMCEAIAHGLNLQGSMNVQLRITGEGPRVFEINPRFSSTTLIRHKFGFEDVRWSLEEMEGKEVVFPLLDVVGKHAVRTFDAAILS